MAKNQEIEVTTNISDMANHKISDEQAEDIAFHISFKLDVITNYVKNNQESYRKWYMGQYGKYPPEK